MNLSPRLEAVAAFVPTGSRVLDVGTDHGYLPIALLQRGVASSAIASDVRPGPLEQARANARAAGLEDRVDLRLGSGLAVARPGEADVAVLAGMGGLLILSLLEAAPEAVRAARRLILAPNTKVAQVRRWASLHRFRFVGEDLVAEGRHLYAILALVPGPSDEAPLSDIEAELGPLLLRQAHPLLPDLIGRLITSDRLALHALRPGETEGRDPRRQSREDALRRRRDALEEVLRCWPKWPT